MPINLINQVKQFMLYGQNNNIVFYEIVRMNDFYLFSMILGKS